jgi:hypothetical protein
VREESFEPSPNRGPTNCERISLENIVISRECLLSLILLLAPVTQNGITSVDRDTILLMGVETKLIIARPRYRPGLSIKYSNLNEGKATAIKIKAGVIVQINSKTVPCVKYL